MEPHVPPTDPVPTASPSQMMAKDAPLTVRIEGGEYDGQTLSCDTLLLGLIVEEVTTRHKDSITMSPADAQEAQEKRGLAYQPDRVYYRRTVGFLKDLSDQIAAAFGFCTPTIADAIWVQYSKLEDALKKNTE